jgi:hypothetical protein
MVMTPPPEPVEVVAGELVPAEPDPDQKPAPLLNLFGTADPDLLIARAGKVARALERVIRDQDLFVSIRGRDHVRVEGWTLLGTMLGVFPVLAWTRPLPDGWEARVEAKTLTGAIVGAAESQCLRAEARWRAADDYALRSMAATRATSKALRQPLGFIMPLAHFAETPLEEIPPPESEQPASTSRAAPVEATKEQLAEIRQLVDRLNQLRPEADWWERCREITGGPASGMTTTIAHTLIGKLGEAVEAAEEFDARTAEDGS